MHVIRNIQIPCGPNFRSTSNTLLTLSDFAKRFFFFQDLTTSKNILKEKIILCQIIDFSRVIKQVIIYYYLLFISQVIKQIYNKRSIQRRFNNILCLIKPYSKTLKLSFY